MNLALWASKTGLDAQQTRMAVVSNNLANVNTTGYKRARPVFEDLLYQNVRQVGAQTSQDTQYPTGMYLGTGVRIVATYGNSSIRGLVRVEGGALPGQMRLMISARRIDAGAGVRDRGGRNAMVDPNGRFQIDQLVGGTYELSLQMPGMGRNAVEPVTVTVGNGGVQEVVVPLNLATLNAQPRPNNGGGGRQRGGRP